MFPVITTERFLLRQIIDSDLENIFLGLSHPDVIKYYGVSFQTLEATKDQIKWHNAVYKEGTGIWWAVTDKEDHTFYGECGFNSLEEEHKKVEIGYWLLRDHWGKGIMKEVLPAIISHAFKNMDLHRIVGMVETPNEASKRTLLKIGFEYEGTQKQSELKNGKFVDLEFYALLNPYHHTS